jgi:hypothetical protein
MWPQKAACGRVETALPAAGTLRGKIAGHLTDPVRSRHIDAGIIRMMMNNPHQESSARVSYKHHNATGVHRVLRQRVWSRYLQTPTTL